MNSNRNFIFGIRYQMETVSKPAIYLRPCLAGVAVYAFGFMFAPIGIRIRSFIRFSVFLASAVAFNSFAVKWGERGRTNVSC